MRAKKNEEDKRAKFIGIKVKNETRKQIEFISEREQRPISTQINIALEKFIKEYFNQNKINWTDYQRKEEEQNG